MIIIDTTRSILHLRIQYLVASTDDTAVLPTSESCSVSHSKFCLSSARAHSKFCWSSALARVIRKKISKCSAGRGEQKMGVVLLGADWPTTKIDVVKWRSIEPLRHCSHSSEVKWKSMMWALLESACSTASGGWGAHPCSVWNYNSSIWYVKSQKHASSSWILRPMKSLTSPICRIHPGWILQSTDSGLNCGLLICYLSRPSCSKGVIFDVLRLSFHT